MELTLATREVDGATVVSASGWLNASTAKDFETAVMPLIDSTDRFVLDCSGLDYITSAGLRVFLLVITKMKASGKALCVASPRKNIKELFQLTGMLPFLEVYATVGAALGRTSS